MDAIIQLNLIVCALLARLDELRAGQKPRVLLDLADDLERESAAIREGKS